MANNATICFRRDVAANWQRVNPLLKDGEVGADKSVGRLKMGDGIHNWNNLGYLYQDTVEQAEAALTMIAQLAGALTGGTGSLLGSVENKSDLTTAFPSAATGDIALVTSENKLYKYDGTNWVEIVMQAGVDEAAIQQLINNAITAAGGVTMAQVENLLNTRLASAVEEKYNSYGFAGIGYTIDEFNAYDKPLKITYSDGTTATMTYVGGTVLTASVYRYPNGTSEAVEYVYDSNGKFTGTRVTKQDVTGF